MTLAAGLLLIGGGLGVAALVLTAPSARGDAEDIRAAVVDHRDDLAFCGAGERGGTLVATIVIERGEPTHVGIGDADVPSSVAHCVAETLVAASWPRLSAAARIPITLE